MRWKFLFIGIYCCFSLTAFAAEKQELPNTQLLTLEGDLSAQMVAGIDRFLVRETVSSISERAKFWQRDFSSHEAYEKSIQTNRQQLRKIIGAVDVRLPVKALELLSTTDQPAKIFETDIYEVFRVRWPVFENVFGEGLWLKQKREPLARVVAVPDADQTPEMLAGLVAGVKPEHQWARRLAENGCEVLVPTLINRDDTGSGNSKVKRFTNQPHREWIYRQAFEMGRHIIGYEVEKILAAVEWFASTNSISPIANGNQKIGVAGYGEGGLLAFYAAALDSRIESALVSGYFDSRQRLWEEPIYRNAFGLLREFGDAEIATLIAPRGLIVEHSTAPKIDGPPPPRDGRRGAAPGKIVTPDYQSVENEFERSKTLLKTGGNTFSSKFKLISGTEGMETGPGSERALTEFLNQLGAKVESLKTPTTPFSDLRIKFDSADRQQRQISELVEHTQKIFRDSESVRTAFFWNKIKNNSPENDMEQFKRIFSEQVIGSFSDSKLPLNPRSRKILENEKWTGHEVVLDVFPDVFAWGILLLPNDLKPGERRPVVVCQHGLEGVPLDVITLDEKNSAFAYYKGFAARLADKGFIVFAPHNPYRGGDKFRVLQRKANPLGKSLFSIITAQHSRILDWLSDQPFVDAQRIGFYGLSYGGKTAMRVPAILDRYALSICSGDFNEWIWKNVTLDYSASYMFTGEYEMPEFNLGNTFNYAEMAALIAPRPFMVERGHNDGVGIDEQVSYEYAKVQRMYVQMGIPDRTEIEFFNGPHQIHGIGTFQFLQKHLNWPGN